MRSAATHALPPFRPLPRVQLLHASINPVVLDFVVVIVVVVMQTYLLGLIVTTNQRLYFCCERLAVATRKSSFSNKDAECLIQKNKSWIRLNVRQTVDL